MTVVLVLAGWRGGPGLAALGAAPADAQQAAVQVTRGSFVQQVRVAGLLSAQRGAVIRNPLDRTVILKTVVLAGEQVAKGQVVAEFTEPGLDLRVAQRRLELAEAQASLQEARCKRAIEPPKLAEGLRQARFDHQAAQEAQKQYVQFESAAKRVSLAGKVALSQSDLLLAEDSLEFMVEANRNPALSERPPYAQRQIQAGELDVQRNRLALEGAQAELEMFDRYDDVFGRRRLQAKLQQAALEVDRKELELRRTEVMAISEVEACEAAMKARQKLLDKLLEAQGKMTATAPADGLCLMGRPWFSDYGVQLEAEPGLVINPYSRLLTIPDLASLVVKVRVYEGDYHLIQPGQTAVVELAGLPGRQLAGSVKRIEPLPQFKEAWLNEGVRWHDTVIECPALREGGFIEGMRAQARIEVAPSEQVLLVPAQAVRQGEQVAQVWMQRNGEWAARDIRVGRVNGQAVEVLEGLEEGQWVLAQPPAPPCPSRSPVRGPLTALATRGRLSVRIDRPGTVACDTEKTINNPLEREVVVTEILPDAALAQKDQVIVSFSCQELSEMIEQQELTVAHSQTLASAAVESLELKRREAASALAEAKLRLLEAREQLQRHVELAADQDRRKLTSQRMLAESSLALARQKVEFMEQANANPVLSAMPPYSQKDLEAARVAMQREELALSQAQAKLTLLEQFDAAARMSELSANLEQAGRDVEHQQLQAQREVASAEAEGQAASARLAIQQGQLTQLLADRDRLTLRAQKDSFVLYDVATYWGQTLSAFQNDEETTAPGRRLRPRQLLLTLPELDSLVVKCELSEADYPRVQVGQAVQLCLAALPGEVLAGKVKSKSGMPMKDQWAQFFYPDQNVFELKIALEKPDPRIRPRMWAQARILVGELENVLLVPSAAVHREADKAYVWLDEADGPRRQEITAGATDGRMVEIKDGLDENQAVRLVGPPQAPATGPAQSQPAPPAPPQGED